jgi:hypothetical protein
MALKAKFPNAFANALRTQNRYLQESYTVVITHIPESAFPHLCQALLKQPGFLDVLKHQRDEHMGKYLIMTNAAQVKNYLCKNLEHHLINQFPKVSTTDRKFDEKPHLMQGDFDDESSNGLSWYSPNIATTFNSIDFGEQQVSYEESSTYSRDTNSYYSAHQKPSYAKATVNKENTTAASLAKKFIVPSPGSFYGAWDLLS